MTGACLADRARHSRASGVVIRRGEPYSNTEGARNLHIARSLGAARAKKRSRAELIQPQVGCLSGGSSLFEPDWSNRTLRPILRACGFHCRWETPEGNGKVMMPHLGWLKNALVFLESCFETSNNNKQRARSRASGGQFASRNEPLAVSACSLFRRLSVDGNQPNEAAPASRVIIMIQFAWPLVSANACKEQTLHLRAASFVFLYSHLCVNSRDGNIAQAPKPASGGTNFHSCVCVCVVSFRSCFVSLRAASFGSRMELSNQHAATVGACLHRHSTRTNNNSLQIRCRPPIAKPRAREPGHVSIFCHH